MRKIDRYEIRGELGWGGMAVVYHAYDPRFQREVALKLLSAQFLGESRPRQRFEREALTIARLEHPAIVPVYDFGEDQGQLYLVMRLMSGGSLADRLRRGPLSLREAAAIFRRLAAALDVAHQQGIIHRDLKPANILFDQWGAPYLSDFGIAKLAESGNTALTLPGGLVGTPAYMSPEQVKGTETLDGRSDIYALGAILYEMLSGKLPYEATTPMALALKHVREPVPRVLDANPALPVAVNSLIAKAMAKEREERFPTATSMATALMALAADPVPTQLVPTGPVTTRPVRERPKPAVPPPPEPPPTTGPLGDKPNGGSENAPTGRRWKAARIVPLVAILVLTCAAFLYVAADMVGAWPPFMNTTTPNTDDLPDNIGEGGVPTEEGEVDSVTAIPPVTTIPTATNTPEPPTATPSPVPTGRIAFVSNRSGNDAVYVMDLDRPGEAQQITFPAGNDRHWWPAWCGPDTLVLEYADQAYDSPGVQEIGRVSLTGDGTIEPITSGNLPANSHWNGLPSCSPDGRHLSFSSRPQNAPANHFEAGWLDLSTLEPTFSRLGNGYGLAGDITWAADGRAVVFMHNTSNNTSDTFEIYRVNLDAPFNPINLTGTFAGDGKYPDWSPLRNEVAFACNTGSEANRVWSLCLTPAGSSAVTVLLEALHLGDENNTDLRVAYHAITPSWSPDGRYIVLASTQGTGGDWDLYRYELATGELVNLTEDWPGDEWQPVWEPEQTQEP